MRAALAALVLGASLPAPARAQDRPVDPLAPARLDLSQLERGYRRAQARRNIGIGLAAPGIALSVLGGVLIVYGVGDPNHANPEIGSGAVSAGVGIALGVPGIVLWILGQEDMDNFTWRKKQVQTLLSPTP